MANIQLVHFWNAGDRTHIVIVETVPRVQVQPELAYQPSGIRQVYELLVLRGSAS